MKRISINSREARAKWRDLLDQIQTEQSEIVIERYGKPIGILKPFSGEDSHDVPTINEPKIAYQITEEVSEMNVDREQLLEQLRTMPDALLETAVQFLQLLQQTQTMTLTPVTTAMAAQWRGLAGLGYDGNALEDSEALYD